MIRWLSVALAVILIDQVSKQWFEANFELWQSQVLLPVLNFTLAHNTGAAFSFLAEAGGWQRWFFTIIAIVVSAVIILWLQRLKDYEVLQGWGLTLILGGAIGNAIDRLFLGYVVDFIDFHWDDWHFPAFNLADSAITLGVILILLDAWVNRHREDES